MKVFVTGANGFVGKILCTYLSQNTSHEVIRMSREPISNCHSTYTYSDLEILRNKKSVFKDVDVVIHLAARVHVTKDKESNSLELFRKVNVDLSLDLAQKALQSGVRRFIYISSIKVNGETTHNSRPFVPKICPSRYEYLCKLSDEGHLNTILEPYSLSKFEAEKCLTEICRKTAMDLVIIRPPLVYGKGVKGNFEKMMKWIHRTKYIPLGGIHNNRSLVYVENLVSLIERCIIHPNAANQTFLVSDGNDISTSKLIRLLSSKLNNNNHMIGVNSYFLKIFLQLFNKSNIYNRLCEDLQVDISKTVHLLEWKPPFDIEKALYYTAESWLDEKKQ